MAQYIGAGRKDRVGPVVWQALYFALAGGVAFMLFALPADWIMSQFGHEPQLQVLEATYFRCLCFAALPMALTAAATAFYLGRGESNIVMLINFMGMFVNAVLDFLWIFGWWGFPEWGIAGAGWATVIGSWVSALLAIGLFLQPKFSETFATWRGWKFDDALFGRLMRFGLPSGLQWAMDGVVFTIFTVIIGQMGPAQIAATSIAFTMNMIAFMPTVGFGQAVSILVGQRLGENKPESAERVTYAGFTMAWLVMTTIGITFIFFPQMYVALFETQRDPKDWVAVAALVPTLLRFVAFYCLFDSFNLIFSFALKGAGDTKFVTLTTVTLAWPLMVLPTYLVKVFGLGVYGAWTAATLYICTLGVVFLFRFRGGKWKSMRVIETSTSETENSAGELSPVAGLVPSEMHPEGVQEKQSV
ncbi:MAG: MATE family efflux transporter [Gemmataceae bacterium]